MAGLTTKEESAVRGYLKTFILLGLRIQISAEFLQSKLVWKSIIDTLEPWRLLWLKLEMKSSLFQGVVALS